jgi:hypothetical protein
MSKSLFNHIDAIYQNQSTDYWDTLEEADRKSWNNWMVNRFISMNSNYVEVVNEVQKYYGQIGDRELYLFYSQLLPKGRQFNKYIKGSKDEAYEDWLLDIVSHHHLVSKLEAQCYLNIWYRTENGRINLRQLLEGYGIEPKRLKGVGL